MSVTTRLHLHRERTWTTIWTTTNKLWTAPFK